MKVLAILCVVVAFGVVIFIYSQPPIGGSFTLVDQNGKSVSDGDFRGKFRLVFFGFTECPDVCPTTLLALGQTLDQLKPYNGQIAALFITVDPEHDTPAQMKGYLSHFNPGITGLTGTKAQIEQAESAYGIYAGKEDSGRIEHSSFIFLMDRRGKYLTHFSVESSPKEIAEKIESYVQQN